MSTKSKTKNSRREGAEAGFLLVEMLLTVAILGGATVSVAHMMSRAQTAARDRATGEQMRQVAGYAADYVTRAYSVLSSTTPVGGSAEVPAAAWRTALPSSFAGTNSYGQQYRLVVLQPVEGRIEAYVATTGPRIPEGRLQAAASAIGGAGGYLSDMSPALIRGLGGGWTLPTVKLTSAGVPATTGSLVASVGLSGLYTTNNYLSRYATGNPESTRMHADIDMSGSSIKAIKDLELTGELAKFRDDLTKAFQVAQDGTMTLHDTSGAPTVVAFPEGEIAATRRISTITEGVNTTPIGGIGDTAGRAWPDGRRMFYAASMATVGGASGPGAIGVMGVEGPAGEANVPGLTVYDPTRRRAVAINVLGNSTSPRNVEYVAVIGDGSDLPRAVIYNDSKQGDRGFGLAAPGATNYQLAVFQRPDGATEFRGQRGSIHLQDAAGRSTVRAGQIDGRNVVGAYNVGGVGGGLVVLDGEAGQPAASLLRTGGGETWLSMSSLSGFRSSGADITADAATLQVTGETVTAQLGVSGHSVLNTVAANTIVTTNLACGSVCLPVGPQGPAGPAGPQGPMGPQGPVGPAGSP